MSVASLTNDLRGLIEKYNRLIIQFTITQFFDLGKWHLITLKHANDNICPKIATEEIKNLFPLNKRLKNGNENDLELRTHVNSQIVLSRTILKEQESRINIVPQGVYIRTARSIVKMVIPITITVSILLFLTNYMFKDSPTITVYMVWMLAFFLLYLFNRYAKVKSVPVNDLNIFTLSGLAVSRDGKEILVRTRDPESPVIRYTRGMTDITVYTEHAREIVNSSSVDIAIDHKRNIGLIPCRDKLYLLGLNDNDIPKQYITFPNADLLGVAYSSILDMYIVSGVNENQPRVVTLIEAQSKDISRQINLSPNFSKPPLFLSANTQNVWPNIAFVSSTFDIIKTNQAENTKSKSKSNTHALQIVHDNFGGRLGGLNPYRLHMGELPTGCAVVGRMIYITDYRSKKVLRRNVFSGMFWECVLDLKDLQDERPVFLDLDGEGQTLVVGTDMGNVFVYKLQEGWF